MAERPPGAAAVARLGRWLLAAGAACTAWLALPLAAAADAWRPDIASWSALGGEARAGSTRDGAWSREGRAALDLRYRVAKGEVSVFVLPVPGAALAAAGKLRFAIRASHAGSLMLALEEQGGGRWTYPVALNANQWQELRIPLAELVLASGGDAPADANGRLDLDRVQRLTLVDVGAMLAAGSADMMRLFDIPGGERRLVLDDLHFAAEAPAAARGAAALDGFGDAPPPWSVFGAERVSSTAEAPLRGPGLAIDYRKKTGRVMSAIRPLSPGALTGAEGLALELGSRMKTELTLKLEQADGGRFEARFELPGDGRLQTRSLRFAEFKRAGDSGTRADQVDPARVNNLLLLDVGSWFTKGSDNRLWLQRVAALGQAAGAAPRGRGRPAAGDEAVAQQRVQVPGWATWSKRVAPVHSGPYSLVGDPSVVRDGELLRMAYSCFDPKRKGPAICAATSRDGLAWTDLPTGGPLPGRILQTRKDKWDDTHETPFLMKRGGEYLLYFSGYRDRGGHFKSFPLQIGMAVSRDGIHFERVGDDPVLKVSPEGYDSDAVFSPTLVEHEGHLVMLYTAYCLDSCRREKGVYLMAATSSDGRSWTKRPEPVLRKGQVPGAKDGAAEAELVKGPDGRFYLFASLLYGGDKGHEIGVASAASPYGPFDFAPAPIVRKGEFDDIGPIAPSVLIEDGRVRMWFHGFSKRKTIQIGYAEAGWPLQTGR